jgi:His-Xaa-Ser system protein HxsD
MQSKEPDGHITIKLDADVYSEQAVKAAIYDLDLAALISLCGNKKKIIQIKIPSPADSDSALKAKIYKAILDHQVRIDVQKEFEPIRKLILAQAFFPCENLGQIMDEMDL